MKIISLIMKKIWRILIPAVLIFVIFIAVLKHGVEIENIDAGDFKIEQLYIKLDKKIILRAKNIEIPKQSAKDSSEEALLDLSKNIVWINRLFDEILLERIKFLNSESTLFYRDDVFYLDSPFLAVSSNFKDTEDGITANIYLLEFKDFNITLSGVSNADLRRQIYDFNGTFSSHELNGNATVNLKKSELSYELSDINATSLRGFMDELGAKTGLDKEIKNWIYGYVTADNYFVKSLRGRFDLNKQEPYLNELSAQGFSKNVKVKFHEKLPAATAEGVDVELKKGSLFFTLKNPKWQDKNLNGSNLEIYKIFEEKGAGLTLNLQTSALYDKSVNSILKAYDIEVPVEQLSGKTDAKLALDIKFDPLEVTPNGKFKITGGQTLIAGAKFNVDTADVELLNDKLKVNTKNTGMDFFSADAAVNLDLGKPAGDINGTLKGLNLAFGKSEILKLGATPFAARLDFSGKDTKLDIASPAAVGLKFGAQNEINLPDVRDLLPYSPLLKSLQISEGSVNIKTKDFENLSIEANGVKFETPLLKKDGSPYDADSFTIDVNAKGATGKSKSGGLNFKIAGGKTELFIKELDLALSGDENLADKDGDIEFEAKGSKLILNDFNATLDLLAYSGQSAGGTVRFDAKPARGNFSLIKSDKKFEMWANDIRGEFINSIFNIKSFEGGSFKMRVLGGSTDDFKGEVRLIGATLKDYTFYNQLLTFLNSVPSLLVFKTPDFGADGYPVKFGKILFEKKGDVLKFLAIELESSSADIGGHGTINLATKEIDVDLELKLLKDASSIIDKIPLINQIVLGKDRTLSTVIKVRGTLQKPQYSTQILQDALLSPFKIIRNVLEAPFLIFE